MRIYKYQQRISGASVGSGRRLVANLVKFNAFVVVAVAFLQGCTGVNTFPTIARAGDTVSVMIGGSEAASTNTVGVSLVAPNRTYDLQGEGFVRSVFNLRADGRADGMHYSPGFFDVENAWNKGHEPIQTVLVFDVPTDAAPGPATLVVALNASDDSSGVTSPFEISIDIIDGAGTSTDFLRQDFSNVSQAVSFASLEPAPHAKISFGKSGLGGGGNQTFYAVSLVVDFDNAVVNADDLNVYSETSTVRGTFSNPTAPFGDKQRSVHWRQDGQQIFIDVIAPQGIKSRYVQLYVLHPRGVSDPGFTIASATFYDQNGYTDLTISGIPKLTYHP